MKKYIIKLSFILIGALLWACSDDDAIITDNERDGAYALFLKNKIQVSGTTGETVTVVEWSQTEWEISLGEGDLVTKITPMTGGNSSETGQNLRIKITYSENVTRKSRVQTIHITNKTNGKVTDLVIEQNVTFKTLSLLPDPSVKYQPVVGFGGMYNPKIWCGSYLITSEQMNKMYGPGGLGYSVLRLMVYPDENDWSADVEAAKMAQSNGAVIFASPWDCTDALSEKIKVGDKEVKHLNARNYDAYADHLIKYINFMKQNGVNLDAISVQNEPDMDFTYWTPQEVVDFVKQCGAKIRATGVKLMSPEACGTSPDYTNPILDDAEAFANTDIVAGHLYQGFINISQAGYEKSRHDYICGLYPRLGGKTWWMTEHLFNEGENDDDPSNWLFQTWAYNFSHLAKEIHMCMEGYCSAYVYWYLKRFYGLMGDNDKRSSAPDGEISKNGYILAHYAQYATGMTRIKVDVENSDVWATAYVNETGSEVTVVLLNMTGSIQNIRIPMSGVKSASAVETNENKNMEAVDVAIESLGSGSDLFVLLSGYSVTSIRLKL